MWVKTMPFITQSWSWWFSVFKLNCSIYPGRLNRFPAQKEFRHSLFYNSLVLCPSLSETVCLPSSLPKVLHSNGFSAKFIRRSSIELAKLFLMLTFDSKLDAHQHYSKHLNTLDSTTHGDHQFGRTFLYFIFFFPLFSCPIF